MKPYDAYRTSRVSLGLVMIAAFCVFTAMPLVRAWANPSVLPSPPAAQQRATADRLAEQGFYGKAALDYQSALALNSPHDALHECEDLNGLIDCLIFSCDTKAALWNVYAARKLEAALPKLDPEADAARCRTLRLLGEIAYYANNTNQAGADYKQALAVALEDSITSEHVLILGDQGDLASNNGDTATAETSLTKALAIAVTMKNPRLEASIRARIGSNLIWENKYDEAVSASHQAASLARSCGDRRTEADALSSLCLAFDYAGRYRNALETGQEGLRIERAIGDKRGEEYLLQYVGTAYLRLAWNDHARNAYAQSLKIAVRIGDDQGRCAVSGDLGNVAVHASDFGAAINDYEYAVKIAAKIGDETNQGVNLSQLCTAYTEVGQYGLALDSGLQALNILKRIDDESDLSACWQHLGRAYRKRGQYLDALACYQEAVSWARKSGSIYNEGAALGSIGESDWLLKRYPDAEAALTQSLALARQTGDTDTEQWATYNLGNVDLDRGEFSRATASFESALASGTRTGERRLQAYANSRLMAAAREQHETSLAIWYGKRSINEFQVIRSHLRGLDPSARRSFIQSKSEIYRALADLLVLAGRISEAEQVLAMLKEEEYFDFIGQKRDPAPGGDAPVEFTPDERQWLAAYDTLGETVEQAQQDAARFADMDHLTDAQAAQYKAATEKSDAATRAFNQLRDNLVKRFDQDDQAAGQTAVTAIKNNDVVKSMLHDLSRPDRRVVELYTVEADNQYDVILQTPDIARWGAYAISAKDLNAKVERYREAIRDPSVDSRPLGHELYQILIGPVEHELTAYQPNVVMWSLDGPLGLIPVAALWDGSQYLVQRWENTLFNPAATGNLMIAEPSTARGENALGLGVSKARTIGEDVFPALDGVPVELSSVIHDPKHLDSASGVLRGRFYLDDEFTAGDALRWLGGGRHPIVHIASHFKLSAAGTSDSYLLIGSGPPLTLAQIQDKSGLFANVDLLTLSACSTAVSTRGIGSDRNSLDSLNELAEREGARSVIASLWNVSDESTALLMQTFYRALASDPAVTKARALRAAQLALLTGSAAPTGAILRAQRSALERASLVVRAPRKSDPSLTPYTPDPKRPYAQPFFWAPFMLLGNWQ